MKTKFMLLAALFMLGCDTDSEEKGGGSQPLQDYVENIDCELNMKMIAVEGGLFQMGATSEQGEDARDNESPVHQVQLESFYIAECEVTQAQWKKIMGENRSEFKDDTHPVEMVNWEDAQKFCRELSALTGKTYQLPTEAQWEYAARGGKNRQKYKYSGSDELDAVAWYKQNSNAKTNPVKQKRANELGLYDMSGNVWEWCSDYYGTYDSSKQNNPTGPFSGEDRVLRGGGFFNELQFCRVSHRAGEHPLTRYNFSGFRVVCLP